MTNNILRLLITPTVLFMMAYPFLKTAEESATETNNPSPIKQSSTANPDFSVIEDIHTKKEAFFNFLQIPIEAENQRVLQEREVLKAAQLIKKKGEGLTKDQLERLSKLASEYQLAVPESGINMDWIEQMLVRVNVLPEALILTQAANESAWGTSRFATEANNYFGQWCYSEGCGLVPEQRPAGATHEVAKFENAQLSVRAYFMNINRNAAYKELRMIREQLATDGDDLSTPTTAIALTQGLLRYSERGQDYIDELQSMIRFNKSYWSHSKP